MLSKDLQFAKAESPINFTESGMAMLAKDMHPSKALTPMAVTD